MSDSSNVATFIGGIFREVGKFVSSLENIEQEITVEQSKENKTTKIYKATCTSSNNNNKSIMNITSTNENHIRKKVELFKLKYGDCTCTSNLDLHEE